MRTWRVTLDDGALHVVEAHAFHDDGTFTLLTVPEQPPVFATLTARIVSISREPDDEKALHEGTMTTNAYRAKLGYPPLTDTDEPVKMLRRPVVGDRVHFVSGRDGACYDSLVKRIEDDGKLYLFVHIADSPIHIPNIMGDNTDHQRCTWHWPCGGDEQPAEPEPDAPAPTTITINVHGSVLSERDLRDAIEKQMLRLRGPGGHTRT